MSAVLGIGKLQYVPHPDLPDQLWYRYVPDLEPRDLTLDDLGIIDAKLAGIKDILEANK